MKREKRHPLSSVLDPATAASIAIVVACLIAFSTSFAGAFVFDDHKQLLLNPGVQNIGDLSAVLSASPRPVTNLTIAMNFALAGIPGEGRAPATFGFHLVNLIVHVLGALVLFGLVRRTSLLERAPAGLRDAAVPIAFAIALIWAVHPLQTQSVTYLVQRSESLMGLFYLLTVYALLRGVSSEHSRRIWFPICVVACALGMGAKAVMVTAPLAAFLFDRTFLAGSFRAVLRDRWWLYLALCATWLVLYATGIAQGVLRTQESAGAAVGFAFKGVSPTTYFLTQPEVLLHYLRLAIAPMGQCLDYGWTPQSSFGSAMPSLLIVSLLGGAASYGLVRNTWWGFVGGFFFIVLAPTSSVIPIKDLAFEHRMYLPLASVVVGFIAALWLLTGRFAGHSVERRRTSFVLIAIIVSLPLIALTISRNRVYASEESLWRDVIAADGNVVRAANNLGVILKKQQRYDEAIDAYRLALEKDPGYSQAHYNLAQLLRLSGRADQSIEHYERAIEHAPRNADIRFNYAGALETLGRREDAFAAYTRTLEISPDDVPARRALARFAIQAQDLPGAVIYIEEIVRIEPEDAEAWVELGNARFQLESLALAAEAYRRALAIRPGDADTWFNLAIVSSRLGQTSEAILALQAATRVDPDHERAHTNLGLMLLEQNRADEALPHLEAAARLRPDSAGVRRALERARALQNNPTNQ